MMPGMTALAAAALVLVTAASALAGGPAVGLSPGTPVPQYFPPPGTIPAPVAQPPAAPGAPAPPASVAPLPPLVLYTTPTIVVPVVRAQPRK